MSAQPSAELTPERLRRILALEQRQGYRDRAVLGGLERLAQQIAASAALRSVSDALRGYDGAPEDERTARVERALRALALLGTPSSSSGSAKQSAPPRARPAEASAGHTSPPHSPSPHAERGTGAEVGDGTRPRPAAPAAAGRSAGPPARGGHPAPRRPGSSTVALDAPVAALPTIKGATATKLQRLGVRTVEDLLRHYPRRHEDFSVCSPVHDLVPGATETVIATVWEARQRRARSGLSVVEALLGDDTGNIEAVWFRAGAGGEYLARRLTSGTRVALSGEVSLRLGRPTFIDPICEVLRADGELLHTGRIVPIYPATEGLLNERIRQLVRIALDRALPLVEDCLPAWVRERWGLLDERTALWQIHFPDSPTQLAAARRRLAFDELLLIQLGALGRRAAYRAGQRSLALPAPQGLYEAFLAALPFRLTAAQEQAIAEIWADLAQPEPMARLLQGDVGSGKTVVAAAAALLATAHGAQAAIMAPTEILAEQHFQTLGALFGRGPVAGVQPRVGLLTGGLRRRERRAALEGLAEGRLDVAIGTHALIEEPVSFARLALTVVDEQHRFGVMQRAALRVKGLHPHLLVMTATPIPRSLALTIYGDLDVSVLGELPPGRQRVATRHVGPDDRGRAYAWLRRRVEAGEQAYIICPLVEESERVEARAAVAEFERLQRDVFPDLRLGLLHGRMRSAEKEAVMRAFRAGEIQILVSTAVVEVGVDVPNATVVLIEGADRFGLAQLHQFRGRVGRGEKQSYCILLAESAGAPASERLEIVAKNHDGFALAEEDLRLRGPGEFFGTRQSGLPDLRLAQLSDVALLEEARAAARELFAADPALSAPEHGALAARVARFWASGGEPS
ncbi:MAG: ATP-dependent DNA helicase RecG [Chloroflexi bacterium]|nr:ATP-dependent DNA helicase RecG [Chloroflexota bacterium]